MSEVTNKVRLHPGKKYTVTYTHTDDTESEYIGEFVEKLEDGFLVFQGENMEPLLIQPGEVTSLLPVRNVRMEPKIKMGKPRGIYIPTLYVREIKTGRLRHTCEEEAVILCRTFGYERVIPFIEGVIDDGESPDL